MKGTLEYIWAAAGCEDLTTSLSLAQGQGGGGSRSSPQKKSQVQSHCVAGHLLSKLTKPSFPCLFPSCLLAARGSELPRCLLGTA